jgi:hypothetical protein
MHIRCHHSAGFIRACKQRPRKVDVAQDANFRVIERLVEHLRRKCLLLNILEVGMNLTAAGAVIQDDRLGGLIQL